MTTYTLSGFGVNTNSDPSSNGAGGKGSVLPGQTLNLTVPDGAAFSFTPIRTHEDRISFEPGDGMTGLQRTSGVNPGGTHWVTLDIGYTLSEITWCGGTTVILTVHGMGQNQRIYALSGDPLPEIGSYSEYEAFEASLTSRSPVATSLEPNQSLDWDLDAVEATEHEYIMVTEFNDLLDGGSGDDILIGGAGDDTFVFRGDFDNDIIEDFDAQSSGEKIDLRGVTGFFQMENIHDHLVQDGNDVVFGDVSGNTITLRNVNLADLDEKDFIFREPAVLPTALSPAPSAEDELAHCEDYPAPVMEDELVLTSDYLMNPCPGWIPWELA